MRIPRPTKYDPETDPRAAECLALDEAERIDLVREYHRRTRVQLPNERLHAAIQAIVENQLALDETVVVEGLDRLQREGLGRHDAIHAIGTVLSEHLSDVLAGGGEPSSELHAPYFERLTRFSAEEWRRSG